MYKTINVVQFLKMKRECKPKHFSLPWYLFILFENFENGSDQVRVFCFKNCNVQKNNVYANYKKLHLCLSILYFVNCK